MFCFYFCFVLFTQHSNLFGTGVVNLCTCQCADLNIKRELLRVTYRISGVISSSEHLFAAGTAYAEVSYSCVVQASRNMTYADDIICVAETKSGIANTLIIKLVSEISLFFTIS